MYNGGGQIHAHVPILTSGWTIRPVFDQLQVSWYNCIRSLTTSRNGLNLTFFMCLNIHIFLYFKHFSQLSFNKSIDFS